MHDKIQLRKERQCHITKQLAHSFSAKIRISEPLKSMSIEELFSGRQSLMLTSKECINRSNIITKFVTDRKTSIFLNVKPNPYKSSVLFAGHKQTVQTQIRHYKTRRLIRVYNACLQNV